MGSARSGRWLKVAVTAQVVMAFAFVLVIAAGVHAAARLAVRVGSVDLPVPRRTGEAVDRVIHAWSALPAQVQIVGVGDVTLSRAGLGFAPRRHALAEALNDARWNAATTPSGWWRVLVDRETIPVELPLLEEDGRMQAVVRQIRHEALSRSGGRAHVDPNAAIEALRKLGEGQPAARIVVPEGQGAAPTTRAVADALATFDVRMSSHVSHFRDGAAAWTRAENIRRAALAIDGRVIEPGAEFSFNQALGERSYGRGYLPSNEVARGEVVEGVGGGICQVATGLHAAALLGGFDILEHHPHSRRLTYAAPGLDAAVAWPNKDLRIRNPYEWPVRIRATARDGTLSVELWGEQAGDPVEWSAETENGGTVIHRLRRIYRPSGVQEENVTIRYPN